MLIRITQNSKGIEDYFETGQKKGREKGRDELDKRVPLSGDLEAFSKAVKYTNAKKKWKNHYWHITGSLHENDQNISDEKLCAIHKEILDYYFCRYDSEKIIHASEAHRPKYQSNAIGLQQRLLHFHTAISKLDPETGNQFRMKIFNYQADRAFQSYLALKYKLEDPARHVREFGNYSLEDWILHHTGQLFVDGMDKLTLTTYKEKLAWILDGTSTLSEAKNILKDLDGISEVKFVEKRKAEPQKRYLQIRSSYFPKRVINLQGKIFRELDRIYYTLEELEERKDKGEAVPTPIPKHWSEYINEERQAAIEEQQTIFRKHQEWWIREGIKERRKVKKTLREGGKALEKRCAPRLEKAERKKEQRVFFVIYKTKICLELIQGYRIWERNNTRYLFNDDVGVKIYDRPDKISFLLPDDLKKMSAALELGLQIAYAKGWDLRALKATGSPEFITEIYKQIRDLIESGKLDQIEPAVQEQTQPEPKPKLNAVDYAQKEGRERAAATKLPKERIKQIKERLDSQTVVDLAVKKWGLPQYNYVALDDNKIGNKRTRKKISVVDFLVRQCNQPISEVFPLLEELLKKQEAQVDVLDDQIENIPTQADQEDTPAPVVTDPINPVVGDDDFDPDNPFPDLQEMDCQDMESPDPDSDDGQEDDWGPRM